ncbi:MAG: TIGR03621 family F420-dependent LLM class oxidoreductase [Actinobacteria bacterium]|nr:MAG: TIGR03621 family F420-dependent LLM class oxidoreductase [Actinomycetota bacterium]
MSGAISFTVQLTAAVTAGESRSLCRRAEALGYAGISISDHFSAQLAPIPALAAAAAITERVRLGFNVLANDFRHPAVLAKELATIDVLSDGRLVAGIGAGWMTHDYHATGIALDRPGVRIERLAEAVTILRGLWGEGPFSFAGSHYRINELDGLPKPVQKLPPILIGGGAPRVLGLAGRVADVVGIALDNRTGAVGTHTWQSARVASTHDKLSWIAKGAEGRANPPRVSVRVLHVAVTDHRARAAADFAESAGLDADEALSSPHTLIGTVGEIVADLRSRQQTLGLSDYVVSQSALDTLAPVLAAI